MSGTEPLNTFSTESIPDYRTPEYFVYIVTAVFESIEPKNAASMAVFAICNLEMLRALAVSRSTQSPILRLH